MTEPGWSTRLVWGGSWLRPGLLFAAWMLVSLTVIDPPEGRLVAWAIGQLVGFAVGALLMAWYCRRLWPAGSKLAASERAQVARAVTRGESPQDRRLALASLQLAGLLCEAADKRRHDRWLVPVLLVAAVGGAAFATAAGRVPLAFGLWALVGLVAASSVHRGERVARITSRSAMARTAAAGYLQATAPRADR